MSAGKHRLILPVTTSDGRELVAMVAPPAKIRASSAPEVVKPIGGYYRPSFPSEIRSIEGLYWQSKEALDALAVVVAVMTRDKWPDEHIAPAFATMSIKAIACRKALDPYLPAARAVHSASQRLWNGHPVRSYLETAVEVCMETRSRLGRDYCVGDWGAVRFETDPQKWLAVGESIREQLEVARGDWVLESVDYRDLAQLLRDEGDRVADAALVAAETERFSRIMVELSDMEQHMFQELWNKGSATYSRLHTVRGCRRPIQDGSERKAVNRMAERVNALQLGVWIESRAGGLALTRTTGQK